MLKIDLIDKLPESKFGEIFAQLQEIKEKSTRCLIVLDDDPTGCQTLHGIPVLFSWEPEVLEKEMLDGTPLLFLMTNSRSLPEVDAIALYREIGLQIKTASEKTSRPFTLISRSDSTLRGHYPAEPNALEFLYKQPPIHCITPAFFQGGRYTIGDEHYVKTGEVLVPASETPFAKDKVFGFTTSNVKKWVEEKTQGSVSAAQVYSFSIEDLRTKGPLYVEEELLKLDPGSVVVVNAAAQNDLDIFALGAQNAEHKGATLLYRTAASFLNSLGGIAPVVPLDGAEIWSQSDKGGLFIVGSYVPKSTAQLEHLLGQKEIHPIELDVSRLLAKSSDLYIASSVRELEEHLRSGRDVVLYTSRKLVYKDDPDENLDIGKKVSDSLVAICQGLSTIPAFIVAKGGITSHDIASRGLHIRRAMVAGPALAGVPVLIPDHRPDLKFIVFPGNVGEDDALSTLYHKLKKS